MWLAFSRRLAAWLAVALLGIAAALGAIEPNSRHNSGPYNLTFLEGGVGLNRPLAADDPTLAANAPWSITGWLRPTLQQAGDVVVAAVGGISADSCRCLTIHDGEMQLLAGGIRITSAQPLQVASWQAFAATYDGKSLQLFIDGQLVGSRALTQPLPAVNPVLMLAPAGAGPERHFGGSLAQLQLAATALSPDSIQQLFNHRPDFSLVVFQNVGVGWPWQEHAWRGLQVPQDPWTLPKANTPPSRPVASSADVSTPALQLSGAHSWTVGAWKLAEAPRVPADGPEVSKPQFDASSWYAAVVPGTVLTTLIARGVYPDPTYGLNNMAIPESLSRQDYWYRSSFEIGRAHV